jgi:hypothetical protein
MLKLSFLKLRTLRFFFEKQKLSLIKKKSAIQVLALLAVSILFSVCFVLHMVEQKELHEQKILNTIKENIQSFEELLNNYHYIFKIAENQIALGAQSGDIDSISKTLHFVYSSSVGNAARAIDLSDLIFISSQKDKGYITRLGKLIVTDKDKTYFEKLKEVFTEITLPFFLFLNLSPYHIHESEINLCKRIKSLEDEFLGVMVASVSENIFLKMFVKQGYSPISLRIQGNNSIEDNDKKYVILPLSQSKDFQKLKLLLPSQFFPTSFEYAHRISNADFGLIFSYDSEIAQKEYRTFYLKFLITYIFIIILLWLLIRFMWYLAFLGAQKNVSHQLEKIKRDCLDLLKEKQGFLKEKKYLEETINNKNTEHTARERFLISIHKRILKVSKNLFLCDNEEISHLLSETIHRSDLDTFFSHNNMNLWMDVKEETKNVIDIKEFLNEIIKLFAVEIFNKNILIKQELNVYNVYSDEIILKIIAANLIYKSIRELPKEGKILIKTNHEQLDNNDFVTFIIEDNSFGLEEHHFKDLIGAQPQDVFQEIINKDLPLLRKIANIINVEISSEAKIYQGRTTTIKVYSSPQHDEQEDLFKSKKHNMYVVNNDQL